MEFVNVPGTTRPLAPQAIVLLDPVTGLPYAAGGGDRAAKALLSAATAPATGAWVATNAGAFSVLASGLTTAGTGAATVTVEASHDGTTPVLLATISLTLGTTITADSFGSVVPYSKVRAKLVTISGTGAAVTCTLGG